MPISDLGARGYAPLESAHRYINRELSWLDFNARVLALAQDSDRPLLERVKFLAIFAREPRRVLPGAGRRASWSSARRASTRPTPDGLTPAEQLGGIRERVDRPDGRGARPVHRRCSCPSWRRPASGSSAGPTSTTTSGRGSAEVFTERIFPVLTPLAVDPGAPVPLHLEPVAEPRRVGARSDHGGRRLRACEGAAAAAPVRSRCPTASGSSRIEHVIAAHLDRLFPGMEVGAHYVFRVTRDADLDVEEDEAGDLLEEIQTVLLRRRRGASCVRLEIESGTPREVRRPPVPRARPRGGPDLRELDPARPRRAWAARRRSIAPS